MYFPLFVYLPTYCIFLTINWLRLRTMIEATVYVGNTANICYSFFHRYGDSHYPVQINISLKGISLLFESGDPHLPVFTSICMIPFWGPPVFIRLENSHLPVFTIIYSDLHYLSWGCSPSGSALFLGQVQPVFEPRLD